MFLVQSKRRSPICCLGLLVFISSSSKFRLRITSIVKSNGTFVNSEVTSKDISLKITVIVYNALLHQINIAVKSRINVIKLRHRKKLHNLKLKQETTSSVDEREQSYIKHTIHNFSSYIMSNEEYTALSFGLDHHVPTRCC